MSQPGLALAMLANVDGAEASIARPREQLLLLERYRHDGQEQARRQETPGDTPCVEKKKKQEQVIFEMTVPVCFSRHLAGLSARKIGVLF